MTNTQQPWYLRLVKWSNLSLIVGAVFILSALGVVKVGGSSASAADGGKFAPPTGFALSVIGQDIDSIEAYVSSVGYTPGGVVGYTSLQNLEGITSVADNGAGRNYLDYLASTYPNSTIVLGLYLVNYLDTINSGGADANIDSLVDHLATYNRPVYLRFGYEFDGSWNAYDPTKYKNAWLRFYNRMVARGVTNIAMVWQSATSCDGTYRRYPISSWYPGDSYVDWMGLSHFKPAKCNFSKLNELISFARSHNKPVLTSESTPQGYELGRLTYSDDGRRFKSKTSLQIWSEWYQPYYNFLYNNQDVMRGAAYINADWNSQPMWGFPYTNGYWGDSRVHINTTILANWKTELDKPYWLHGSPTLFATLGYL